MIQTFLEETVTNHAQQPVVKGSAIQFRERALNVGPDGLGITAIKNVNTVGLVKIAQQCAGQCKDNATCNHLTGQCDSGCADGWTGENCSKACDSGFYGNNCSSVCFLNCPNCRHTDGYCDYVTEFRGFNGSTESVTAYSADQNTLSISSWVVGFSISILVNIILLVSSGLLLRFYLNKRKGKPTQMNYQFSESRESHGYEDLRAATNVNTYDNLTFP